MNKRILYIDDFAYGRDSVLAVAHELGKVADTVHLHDKLTEAAADKFVQGDYDAVVSHVSDAAQKSDVVDRIGNLEGFINSRVHNSYEATEMRYGHAVDLLARMRKHRDVPIVVYSGLQEPDRKWLRNDATYDVLIPKSVCIPPALCGAVALLLDRYERLSGQAQEPLIVQDGQRVSVTTTVRNFNLSCCSLTGLGRLFRCLSTFDPDNLTISVSGLPHEPQFTVQGASMVDFIAKTSELSNGFCFLVGLTITISANCDENGETPAKLAAIAKWVNTRFLWESDHEGGAIGKDKNHE